MLVIRLMASSLATYGAVGVIRALVPFVMLPILTRHLTVSDFGILMIIETTVAFASPFVLGNISGAISVEFFHLTHFALKDYLTNALLLCCCAVLAATGLSWFVTIAYPNVGGIPSILWMLVPLFASLRIVSSVALGILQMRQDPRRYALFVLFQVSVDIMLSYTLVVALDAGFVGRLAGTYGGFFFGALLGFTLLVRLDLLSFQLVVRYSKRILSFTVPLIPHTLAGATLAMSDRYFIAAIVGKDAVGVYSVAYQVASIMLLVAMSVCQAWNPILFRLLRSNTTEEFRRVRLAVGALAVGFIAIGAAIYLVSDYLFDVFVDRRFDHARIFFPWLLGGFVSQSLYLLLSSAYFFYKRISQLAAITTFFGLVNILLNYVLIHEYGVMGGAYSTMITWLLTFLCIATFWMRLIRRQELMGVK